MTDLEIVRWIRGLDENGAVGLARALIFAEAGLHGLSLDDFTMSGRVKAADEGIDGRSHFPPEMGERFPAGPCIWQVKSGSTPPSASSEFDAEKHGALVAAIADGYDYVLFWTNDPVDQSGTNVRDEFTSAVHGIRAGATAHFLFTEAIERLLYVHLGVLAQASPYPLAGLVNLARWGSPLAVVEFQTDALRTEALPLLRTHVSAFDSEPYELHVFGDRGVGKSRLVYEALARPGIEERVLVAPDSSQFDRSLLTHVANSEESRLILVIDDCEAADRLPLSQYAGMAAGRIRLITIGPRWSRDQPGTDVRRIEVLPLEAQASRQIALSIGLGDRDADIVAEYTEGYPGIAHTLARAFRFGTEVGSLVDRVRGDEEIGSVLARLLPAQDVPLLGILALFEKLGFEGDLSQELSLVCRVLEADEANIRQIVDRELGRFVSSAGRFRRVTPRLFAVWLATRLVSEDRSILGKALADLPESLRNRIVTQVRDFAGDPVVEEVLGDTLTQSPFLEGTLSDVDEGASRLLHVAAIAAPSAAMAAIERVLSGVSAESLMAFGPGRREMVWALEVLLWFEDSFDSAADSMLKLAMAENETWASNATGIVKGVFRIHLGGTGASYRQRLQWARAALDQFGDLAKPIIVDGLGNALESHESRSSTHFGGRTAPEEWQPGTVSEDVEARGGAWDLLIEIARSSSELSDRVAKVLAQGVRTAIHHGLAGRVLEDLRNVAWSPVARGQLGEALINTIKYDKPSEDLSAKLRELETELRGRELTDRLDYVFSLSPWQLGTEEDEKRTLRPKILVELAQDLAREGPSAVVSAAQESTTANQQTVHALFEELGRISDDGLLNELESLDPVPEAAVLGALAGLAEQHGNEWADAVLDRWADGSLAGIVLPAVYFLPATDRRALLATSVVDRGLASPTSLGRFLYGAWTRPLSEPVILEIARRLAAPGGSYEIEHALGIVEQWIENREAFTPSRELRTVVLELIGMVKHLPDRTSPMVPLYRARLLRALGLSFDELLAVGLDILRSLDSFPTSDDLEVVDMLVEDDPRRAVEAFVDLLAGSQEGSFEPGLMWLEDARLLSRLQRFSSADLVVSVVLDRVDENLWPRLVAHIDFSPDQPAPLLRTLLERSDGDALRGRAAFRFLYPKTGWTGPESAHLRERREIAEQWIELATEEGSFRKWLETLIKEIDLRIEAAERDEAERGY